VEAGNNSRYIRVPQPGLRYRIDFGIAGPSGAFVPLCRSSEVVMPTARVHESIKEQWVRADTDALSDFSARPGSVTDCLAAAATRQSDKVHNDSRESSTTDSTAPRAITDTFSGNSCSSRFIPYANPERGGASGHPDR
jgi:hypothetical protein